MHPQISVPVLRASRTSAFSVPPNILLENTALVPPPLFFFFFKQKTAYELQGDWSSDVCSSDLHRAGRCHGAGPGRGHAQPRVCAGTRLGAAASAGQDFVLGVSRALLGLPAGQCRGKPFLAAVRSEERRVGKECRSRWSPYH